MTTPGQIAAWAASGESEVLEFKKSTAEKDRACRTLCAFANGRGGRLLFGVTPLGKVVGQTVTDRTLEELAQEFQGFEPPTVSVRDGAVIMTFGLPMKAPGKTPVEIMRLLREEPDLSMPQLAARLGKSERAVERAVKKLREANRLVRVGPAKGGHWQVVD